jgi:hypothetical protein
VTRYRVELRATLYAFVTVEADSEDEAIDMAYDEAPGEICAQCSGWGREYSIDQDDWQRPDDASIRILDGDES